MREQVARRDPAALRWPTEQYGSAEMNSGSLFGERMIGRRRRHDAIDEVVEPQAALADPTRETRPAACQRSACVRTSSSNRTALRSISSHGNSVSGPAFAWKRVQSTCVSLPAASAAATASTAVGLVEHVAGLGRVGHDVPQVGRAGDVEHRRPIVAGRDRARLMLFTVSTRSTSSPPSITAHDDVKAVAASCSSPARSPPVDCTTTTLADVLPGVVGMLHEAIDEGPQEATGAELQNGFHDSNVVGRRRGMSDEVPSLSRTGARHNRRANPFLRGNPRRRTAITTAQYSHAFSGLCGIMRKYRCVRQNEPGAAGVESEGGFAWRAERGPIFFEEWGHVQTHRGRPDRHRDRDSLLFRSSRRSARRRQFERTFVRRRRFFQRRPIV